MHRKHHECQHFFAAFFKSAGYISFEHLPQTSIFTLNDVFIIFRCAQFCRRIYRCLDWKSAKYSERRSSFCVSFCLRFVLFLLIPLYLKSFNCGDWIQLSWSHTATTCPAISFAQSRGQPYLIALYQEKNNISYSLNVGSELCDRFSKIFRFSSQKHLRRF